MTVGQQDTRQKATTSASTTPPKGWVMTLFTLLTIDKESRGKKAVFPVRKRFFPLPIREKGLGYVRKVFGRLPKRCPEGEKLYGRAKDRVPDARANVPLPIAFATMLSSEVSLVSVGDQKTNFMSGPETAPIGARIPTIDLVLLSVSLSLLLAVFTIGIRS